ncbi:MAG: MFS transporter [Myxococcota bacterium]
MSSAPPSTPPLTTATKHWYAVGQFAEGLKNESYSVFLLFYYTAVLGLEGGLAGAAILIALLFDGITDPLAGVVSDRFQSRFGRRHPFMLASVLPLVVFFYLSFAPPPDLSQTRLFAWLACTAVATRASMTLFHVPHLSLGAELSGDYVERTSIVTLAYLYTRIGHALAGGLAFLWFFRPTAAFEEGRFNPDAYPALALTLCVLMLVAVLASVWKTRHRIPYLHPPDDVGRSRSLLGALVGDMVESLRNPSFRALFFGLMLNFICWGVVVALGLHNATYFWFVSNEHLVIWGIFTGVGIFAGLPWWEKAAARMDKKPAFMSGLALFTVATAVPPILKMLGFWPAQGSALYIGLWCFSTGLVAHFGIAATMVTGRSMMADVTDEDMLNHGRRREGIFFGAISFSAKAAFGVGSAIAGYVVAFVGLTVGQDPATAGPTIVNGLGTTFVLSIVLLCGGSLFFFSRYDLDRERHAEISAALAAKGAAEGSSS